MTLDLRLRSWLVVALLVGATPLAHAQPLSGNGVIINPTPLHLLPDPARTPLATLPAGANVRVLAREGDWLRVVFRDRYLGDRTGYVLAANVRIEPMAAPPSPVAPPPIPGQFPPPAASQPPASTTTPTRVERDRGYLWLSGTYQHESTAFRSTSTSSANDGTGSITTDYDGVQPAVVDIALGQRAWRGLSIGVAMTWAGGKADAAVTASVPSPVPGAGPRSVSGRAAEITRQELGIHFDAGWSAPAHGRFQATVFAGPSLFRVKQGLVTAVTVNEAAPFETATFGSATVVESTRQRIGANAGIEAQVRLSKALGIGGIVRYSRARVPFSPAPATEVTIEAGGIQAGGGLHFRF